MIENYEKSIDDWLKQMKWKENPFVLKIEPMLFVGYTEQLKRIVNHIREGHKVALVTGSTGSGKTTLLKLLENDLRDEYVVLYVPKPPKKEEIVNLFLYKFKPSLFERLFHVNVRLQNLPSYLNKKLGEKKLLVLLDETHEADIDTLEWLRAISDQVENMQIILAGLPTVDNILRKNLETLRSRIITHVELTTLTREHTHELIRKRIESVGGEGIKPFSEECIEEIYKKTGGFPREILKFCDKLVQDAIERGSFEIHGTENVRVEEKPPAVKDENPEVKEHLPEKIDEILPIEEELNKDFLRNLPYKQRKIIDILSEVEDLYPSEIAERIGFDKYKSKQHAVRSVNNILKRLMRQGYVERKSKGKGFVYFLSIKIRNLLVKK